MDFIAFSLSGFDDFLLYFGLSIAFVAIFLWIYLRITPYHEIQLIREGNTAAAVSLSGTLIGYTLPLASAVIHSVNPWDMMIWALIALVVQILVYVVVKLMVRDVARQITEGKIATGVFLGALSLGAGILNAACMTY